MTPYPHEAHLVRLAKDMSLQVWMWYPAGSWGEMLPTALMTEMYENRTFALGPKPTSPPPKRCVLGGRSFPEPVRVAPAYGTEYWVADIAKASGLSSYYWGGNTKDTSWLATNLIQLTEDGAREQAAAMAAALQGAVEESE